MGIFNKNKTITLYGLTSRKITGKIFTITLDQKAAFEYKLALLRFRYEEHFEIWCNLRSLDKNNKSVWLYYYETCVDNADKEDLVIIKIKYKLDKIAAIIRMFIRCVPLDCSFDIDVEKEYFTALAADVNLQNTSDDAEENNLDGCK